ncbi:MAG: SIS domain-containing protein [Pirellulales bacterium]|nr:SIS domain-containing protein [Pirellulales bacterium]
MADFAAGASEYIAKLQDVLSKIDAAEIAAVAEVFRDAYDREAAIFLLGNGGSGAAASHMVCDLNKGACFEKEKKFRVMALTDCAPMILALGNDAGFESIFVEQLKNFARPGDVVMGISGSGNSPNVLRAIEYANQLGCTTVAACGYDGGKLKGMVDHCFHVKVDDMQIAEDVHLVLGHILMRVLS